MRLKIVPLFLVVLALGSAVSEPVSASTVGAKCSRLGATVKSGKSTLRCQRVGKSLKWVNVKSSAKNEKGAAASTNCYSVGSRTSAGGAQFECRRVVGGKLQNIEIKSSFGPVSNPVSPESITTCRIPDARTSNHSNQAITFPAVPQSSVTNAGVVRIGVIAVDFPDVQGTQTELSGHLSQVRKAAEWINWYSQGVVQYDLRISDRWTRASGPSSNYFWLHPGKSGTQGMSDAQLAGAYTSYAQSAIDMSGVTVIWVIHPKGISAIDEGFAYRGVPSIFSIGSDTYRGGWPIWQSFIHETLHSHGILGHSPKTEFYGLFNFTGSPGATLNSWDAIAVDWMKESNLYCVHKDRISPATLTLVPLEREQQGLRAVVVRTSPYEALVIESHRRDKWSDRWPAGTYGVTVFKVDTRVDTDFGPGRSMGNYLMSEKENSLLLLGESVTLEGIKVSLTASGDNDTIQISAG